MGIKYICRAQGCNAKIDHMGYCSAHQHIADEREANRFANARKNYHTSNHQKMYQCARWRALRHRIIARDGCCVVCGATTNLHVDHIEPHNGHEDLFYDESNLQVLCRLHHGQKTAIESQQKAASRR